MPPGHESHLVSSDILGVEVSLTNPWKTQKLNNALYACILRSKFIPKDMMFFLKTVKIAPIKYVHDA